MLTVGCEAEHDDAEDELSDAHWEDPVDGHFDGILFNRVMFLDAVLSRCSPFSTLPWTK
jgi:hypothetical protein